MAREQFENTERTDYWGDGGGERGEVTRVKTRRFESSIRNAKLEGDRDFRKQTAHRTFRKRTSPDRSTCLIRIKRGRFHDLITRRSTAESNKARIEK